MGEAEGEEGQEGQEAEEEEEKEKEEEGEEGEVRRRQAQEGPAQEQGQDRVGEEGGCLHEEEGAEQGPQRRQDRGHLRRRLHVQARGRGGQARQVSECVLLSPVISTPGSRGC